MDRVVMDAWNLLWRQYLTQPSKVLGAGSVLVWGGLAVQALGLSPTVTRASRDVALAGGFLVGLSVVIYLLRVARALMPQGTGMAAAVMIDIAVYGFFVLTPPLLVSLVTSGGSWSAVGAAMLGRGGHGLAPDLLGGVRFACQLASLLILTGFPAVLRHRLPWRTASSLARSLVPSWLAAAAATPTWLLPLASSCVGDVAARDARRAVRVRGVLRPR